MELKDKILALPGENGLDAVVGVSPENFTYMSGSYIFTTRTLPPRQACAVVPATGSPFVLVCSLERAHPEEESWIRDIRTYIEFREHPMDALAGALVASGLSNARIGIDLQFLPHASFARLSSLMPEASFVDASDIVSQSRSAKTEAEISSIERASLATVDAASDAMRSASPGETEKTMADRLLFNMIKNGADGTTFLVFGSGRRSAMAHAAPTDRVPREGEIIRFDFGGSFGQWQSDFARTYSAGNPTQLQRDTYRALRAAQAATIGMMGPGVAAEDVFYACQTHFEQHGIRFVMPHVGHGFGIELHEFPMLRPGNTTKLQPGMVLNVEPVTIDAEGSGYQLEDLVLITDTGSRLLTRGLAPEEIPTIGDPVGVSPMSVTNKQLA